MGDKDATEMADIAKRVLEVVMKEYKDSPYIIDGLTIYMNYKNFPYKVTLDVEGGLKNHNVVEASHIHNP